MSQPLSPAARAASAADARGASRPDARIDVLDPPRAAVRSACGGAGADYWAFLRSWSRAPGRVGAIAPSGAALARLITAQIDAGTGPVLELGPGTGVFTRALLERGVAERDLTLVEYGPDFARLLGERFPQARVLCADARRLRRARLFGDAGAGAAVSGLPLRNLPPRQRLAVLLGAFAQLREDGACYQFTYGLSFPLPRAWLERYGFKVQRLGAARLNLPPASVYRVTRRRDWRRMGV